MNWKDILEGMREERLLVTLMTPKMDANACKPKTSTVVDPERFQGEDGL